MRNVNISNFRKDLFSYVSQAIEFGDPINVSAKNGNVVVLSEEEYRGMKETVHLLSNPQMRDILLESKELEAKDMTELNWREELGL